MGVIKFFGSGANLVRIASPIEPETHRALKAYKGLPSIEKQFEIDGWVKDIKTAAGLPHAVDNLHTIFDVVYLFGVNNRINATVDFVSGTLKAQEISLAVADFIPWTGYYSSGTSGRGVNTKWRLISPGNKGIPNSHHIHLASLSDVTTSATTSIGGFTQYGLIPLQTLSGVMRFRFQSGNSIINNFNNDNVLGGYTIKRESDSLISYQKNENEKQTTTRTYIEYQDLEYYLLGQNTGGAPGVVRGNMTVGSFTAGAVSVNGALLARADKNYFIKQGIVIY